MDLDSPIGNWTFPPGKRKHSLPPDPDQLSLPVGPATAAIARKGDPSTSHAAAAAQGHAKLRASQRRVLVLFHRYGNMDDRELREAAKSDEFVISDSGLRSRRAELCAPRMVPPLIEDSGLRNTYEGGHKGIVWTLTAEGRARVAGGSR